MKILRTIFLTFLTTIYIFISQGQTIEFKKYSYDDTTNFSKFNFSFDIPKDWIINGEYDGTGYFLNCKPTSDSEIVKYGDCFDGLIFRIKYLYYNLDSALLEMGLQHTERNLYVTTGYDTKIKIVTTSDLKSDTYTGLHYSYRNDIICKSDKKHKTTGQFQFIYFSDGKQTICIITNGKKLDDNVFNQITKSFKFK